MTGGVAVVLGGTGRNFGAGMSGGVAYVLDEAALFEGRLNGGMVGAERLTSEVDQDLLRALVARHAALTGSVRAGDLLGRWEAALPLFWKVAPLVQGEVAERGTGRLELLLREMQEPVAAS